LPVYLLILLFIFVYMLMYDHMFVSEFTNKNQINSRIFKQV
jgi:hypothetical protein